MNDHLRSLMVAGAVTVTLLAINMSLVISSVKAQEGVKTYLSSQTNLELTLDEQELVGKIRQHLPKKNVDYSKVRP